MSAGSLKAEFSTSKHPTLWFENTRCAGGSVLTLHVWVIRFIYQSLNNIQRATGPCLHVPSQSPTLLTAKLQFIFKPLHFLALAAAHARAPRPPETRRGSKNPAWNQTGRDESKQGGRTQPSHYVLVFDDAPHRRLDAPPSAPLYAHFTAAAASLPRCLACPASAARDE